MPVAVLIRVVVCVQTLIAQHDLLTALPAGGDIALRLTVPIAEYVFAFAMRADLYGLGIVFFCHVFLLFVVADTF